MYNDNVGILLTDDGAILKKAKDLYIRDKVITSAELLEYFEKIYPKKCRRLYPGAFSVGNIGGKYTQFQNSGNSRNVKIGTS